jgi:hypothetical protein
MRKFWVAVRWAPILTAAALSLIGWICLPMMWDDFLDELEGR